MDAIGPMAVAISGGVDSMTLGVLAHRRAAAVMVHAVSPAVPPAATRRVRAYAGTEGWALEVINAGEFVDPLYRRNPVNRCYYCKTHLYGAIADRIASRPMTITVVSGTNLDDLGDYRPGLEAARAHGVRHPFVEAGIDKAGVRTLATDLGLDDLATLPAAPCLSSRVETGIAIEARVLRAIDRIEALVREEIAARVVRCRRRRSGFVIELDAEALAGLSVVQRRSTGAVARALLRDAGFDDEVGIDFALYRMGSAFLRGPAHAES